MQPLLLLLPLHIISRNGETQPITNKISERTTSWRLSCSYQCHFGISSFYLKCEKCISISNYLR
ncbi:hypothetical protein PGB90_009403 [Kerria lacca]